MQLRSRVRQAIRRAGYDVHRVTGDLGEEPYTDIRRLAGSRSDPVCINVGAHLGQTIDRLRKIFDEPQIHAFEPGSGTFAALSRAKGAVPGVQLSNCALGSVPATMELVENTHSDMNSLLEPGPDPFGTVKRRVPVEVRTLDDYCAEAGVEAIDVLKSDTQGFGLEVLRGARRLLEGGAVHLVLIEINLNEAMRACPGSTRPTGSCTTAACG